MTREVKLQVLKIFEELNKFSTLGPVTHGPRFSHSHCGICGALQGMAVNHMPDCPVEIAAKAFQQLLPGGFIADREKWLAEVDNGPESKIAPQPTV